MQVKWGNVSTPCAVTRRKEEYCLPFLCKCDIDSLTHCITDYINFCVENAVPTRTVHCFSNNKPWVTPELKAQLNQKKRSFRSGDKEELRKKRRKN